MKDAYESAGFEVYGAILQGKTAEDLERDSGIQSRTIAKMLSDLVKGKLVLDNKSVIVVDEAGMVGSRDLEKLMAYVEAAGARLRLVGDAKQLAAVEYGNAFVEISKRCEVAALTEIMRQKTDWQIAASEKLASHDIGGLTDYAERGHVRIQDTTKDAQIALVKDWSQHRAAEPQQTSIVLAHTNVERIALNRMMRAQLKKEGGLQEEFGVTTTIGVLNIAVGERIMFTAGDRIMGVKNGSTGTVTAIRDGVATVLLEGGKEATFPLDGAGRENGIAVDYGYAVTVHKSQGMTVDRAFVLGNPGMTLENLYVSMTRHRHGVEFYASAEDFQRTEPGMGMGKLIAHGADHYNFDEQERMSYFATIQNPDGSEATLWGVDIERAIIDSGAQIDDTIMLANVGQQEVTINKDIRDADGKVVGTEEIKTHRNAWGVKFEPTEAEQQQAIVDAVIRKLDRAGHKSFSAENEAGEWLDTERTSDSVVGQMLAEINAEKVIKQAAHTARHHEIIQHLEPQRVLDFVSKEYAADLTKYEIIQTDDGRDLIKFGDKDYNVSEFLTKHMRLDYKTQAAPVLKQCYAEQLENVYSVSRHEPGKGVDQSLRDEFADFLKTRKAQYDADKEALGDRKREEMAIIDSDDLSETEKAAERSALSNEIAALRAELKAENDKPTKEIYKDFLAGKAVHSKKHLDELWRVAVTAADRERLAVIEQAHADAEKLRKAEIQAGIEQALDESMTQTKQAIEAATAEKTADAQAIEQSEKAAAELAAEIERASEPAMLADIQQQIKSDKPIEQATSESRAFGPIVASNDMFIAVSARHKTLVLKIADIAGVKYDGVATGQDRFAKGNEVLVSDAKVKITEKREQKMTLEKRLKELEKSKEIER
jgi:hypothetical protein